jgi:low affinity Fe/Cu permease
LLEASRPREGTHREATEYLVWLLDELLRPPDDRVDDVALATGRSERYCVLHCPDETASKMPRPSCRSGCGELRRGLVWYVLCTLDGFMHEQFRKFARRSSEILGSAEMFLVACVAIVVWSVLGPRYHYSDTWQLVINTATTIVTFLMVFIIQNTQNRDARAIQLKLDELIRAVKGARTGMVRLEELTDDELCALTGDFEKLRARLAATGQGPSADRAATQPSPANLKPETSGNAE